MKGGTQMATLRQAIPDYKTNGIFKNMSGISDWGITPEILDITMMGKYGNRTISPLLREFTNNMGVINDMPGLSNMLSQLNMQNWSKTYAALDLEYNPIEPYKKDTDETINVERDITQDLNEVVTDDIETTQTGTVSDNGSHLENIDTTKTNTLSGSDTSAKTGTETDQTTYNSSNTQEIKLDNSVQKGKSGVIEVTQDGTESSREYTPENPDTGLPIKDRNYTETFSDTNREHEGSDTWQGGVSHTLSDTTISKEGSTVEQVNAANPYDESTSMGNVEISDGTGGATPTADETTSTSGFKPTDMSHVANNDHKYGDRDLSENTLNQDFSHNKVYEVSDKTLEKSFNNRTETTVFGGGGAGEVVEHTDTKTYHMENGQKVYDEVVDTKGGTDTDQTTYNTSDTTTYGKVETLEEDGTDEVIIRNTRTDNLTNTKTGTVSKANDNTIADDTATTRDSLSTGNLGFITSQQQIEQELELRKKHFYDIILKDVVDLITIKVYS